MRSWDDLKRLGLAVASVCCAGPGVRIDPRCVLGFGAHIAGEDVGQTMKAGGKMRLKAQLATWLVAQLLTLAVTSLLSIALHASGQDVPLTGFAIFGALTVVMAYVWVRLDAKRAFVAAVDTRQVGIDGIPPRITFISPICSRRWLVLLYVQLHPELIDSDFA